MYQTIVYTPTLLHSYTPNKTIVYTPTLLSLLHSLSQINDLRKVLVRIV